MNQKQFTEALFQRAKSAGIGDCEAYFSSGDSFSVDVLNGEINEYSVSKSGGVGFRGVYQGKMGYASSEIIDEESIDMLVDGVVQNAQLLETKDGETIYEGDKEYPAFDSVKEETVRCAASDKIAMALRLEELVKGKDGRVQRVEGCSVMSDIGSVRIVNSKGMDISYQTAEIGAYVAPVVSEGEKVNFGSGMKFSHDVGKIDLEKIASEAVGKATAGLGAESIPSGEYRCVFNNEAAATVLSTFAGVFSGEAARKGMSLLKGKEGEKIASDAVTIVDDPLLVDGSRSSPFDCEGVACFTKNVVENGTLKTLLHNRMTAALLGGKSTGNASKAGLAGKIVVSPSNLFFKPSETTPDELLRQVDSGVMITSLMGMHSGANAITGDFSLGAKGFLIENGKVTRPVEQITVAGNFFDLLKNTVMMANDLRFGFGGIGSPAWYVGEIKVAGKN